MPLNQIVRTTLTVALLSFGSAEAFSQQIVVVRGPYLLTWEEELSSERSHLVAHTVETTARENAAHKIIKLDADCEDKACLDKAVKSLKADDGIWVKVEESTGIFTIEIATTTRSLNGEWTGTFSGAIQEVARLTRQILTPEPKEPVVGPEVEPEPEPEPEPESESKDHLVPVWVLLGVTAGTAVSWGIVEGISFGRIRDYKNADSVSASEVDKIKSLQLTGRILLGTSVAMAVATGVVALVAVRKGQDRTRTAQMSLWIAEGGSGVALTGEF